MEVNSNSTRHASHRSGPRRVIFLVVSSGDWALRNREYQPSNADEHIVSLYQFDSDQVGLKESPELTNYAKDSGKSCRRKRSGLNWKHSSRILRLSAGQRTRVRGGRISYWGLLRPCVILILDKSLLCPFFPERFQNLLLNLFQINTLRSFFG